MDITLTKSRISALPLGAIAWVVGIVLAVLFLIWFDIHGLLKGRDWQDIFVPATRELLALGDPYIIEGFYNPPWALIFIAPLTILPADVGAAIIGVLRIAALGYVAYRLGAKRLTLAYFILTPHVLSSLVYPGIDFLPALGFILPPWIGAILVMTKPQAGIIVILYWLVEAWSDGGIKRVAKTFAPLTAVVALSFAMYGFWPAKMVSVTGVWWNISPFPYLIPLGIMLAIFSIKKSQIGCSILASPMFAPYVGIASLPTIVLGFLPSQYGMIAACIGLWLMQLLTGRPL